MAEGKPKFDQINRG